MHDGRVVAGSFLGRTYRRARDFERSLVVLTQTDEYRSQARREGMGLLFAYGAFCDIPYGGGVRRRKNARRIPKKSQARVQEGTEIIRRATRCVSPKPPDSKESTTG